MSIPDTVNALVIAEDKVLKLTSIPFGTTKEVIDLAPDEIIVRIALPESTLVNVFTYRFAFAQLDSTRRIGRCAKRVMKPIFVLTLPRNVARIFREMYRIHRWV